MTNLNESLAIYMGFERDEYITGFKGWRVPGPSYERYLDPEKDRYEDSSAYWLPTENLNQASLVIKKLGEMGKGADFAIQLAAITSQWVDPPYAERLISLDSDALWNMLQATAAQQMQAAYKVIKGGEAL